MKEGGPLRYIIVDDLSAVTVQFLIERAKQIYFPNGCSSKGNIDEMNFSLGNFSRQKITDFYDKDGESCSFFYLFKGFWYLSIQV